MEPINLFDFERLAQKRLPDMTLGYYQSGARDELTLRSNREAYERVALHYRVLVDVSRRDTRTTVLGTPIALPVLVAPTAFHRLAHPDGELATARAAGRAGTIMILSTLSTTDMEAVVAAATGPVWFQLYVYKDREATRSLVQRAEAAGCEALVLTVDAPILGTRERVVRNRFHLPPGLSVRNLSGAGLDEVREAKLDSGLAAYVAERLDPSLTWADLDWLASITRLPLVVKGIVRPDDAVRAVAHGARGVVVSNHGGRQLDTAPATLDVLPAITEAVAGEAELFLDGGIRRGTDVIKALALGARAVLVGRPILWGLAVDGADGAAEIIDLLRREIDEAMALCGCPTVAAITPDLVGR
ncbi:MAG: alpha-hydroxy acid oxidase [bacterium]